MKPRSSSLTIERLAPIILAGIAAAAARDEAPPGRARLAAELGCGKETIRDAIARLEAEGVVRIERQGRHYRITIVAAGTRTAWTGIGPRTSPRDETMRPCLRCRRDFASTGPGNRLCEPCRSPPPDASVLGYPDLWA